MGVETVGSPPRRGARPPGEPEAPAPVLCPLEALAGVLGGLAPDDAGGPEQVRARAVGLGLLRPPGADAGTELTVANAARLLLAGYRLPAHVEAATWDGLRRHRRDGRLVFLLLGGPAGGELAPAVQVHEVPEGLDGPGVLAGEPGAAVEAGRRLPFYRLAEVWAAAGSLAVVAARRWEDLRQGGRAFFGGRRNRDGTYHWDAAEYDTDEAGNILCC